MFDTDDGNTILSLDKSEYYGVVSTNKGDLLVKSGSDHQQSSIKQKGQYYYVDFKDDEKFEDMPHLFLEKSRNQFISWVLPKGLPTGKGDKNKIVKSEETLNKDEMEDHIKG